MERNAVRERERLVWWRSSIFLARKPTPAISFSLSLLHGDGSSHLKEKPILLQSIKLLLGSRNRLIGSIGEEGRNKVTCQHIIFLLMEFTIIDPS